MANKRAPRAKKREINKRWVIYRKARFEGYSKYAAGRLAGFPISMCLNAKNKIEKRIPDYCDALELAGATRAEMAKQAFEGLNAMKTQACDIYVRKSKNGKLEFCEDKSFIDVPDWNVRHKYHESILRDQRLAVKSDTPLIDQSEHTHLTIVVEGEDDLGKRTVDQTNEETVSRVALTDE